MSGGEGERTVLEEGPTSLELTHQRVLAAPSVPNHSPPRQHRARQPRESGAHEGAYVVARAGAASKLAASTPAAAPRATRIAARGMAAAQWTRV
jgi:hypothetical protein